MRAAEDDNVGSTSAQRIESGTQHPVDDGTPNPAFFDDLLKAGTADADDLRAVGKPSDEITERTASCGRWSRNDADNAALRLLARRLHRRDDADKGNGEFHPQRSDGIAGCGVAGDNDGLASLTQEETRNAGGSGDELCRSLLAIRNIRLVCEEDEPFFGEQFLQFPQHGQAPDARVEDPDRIGWAGT